MARNIKCSSGPSGAWLSLEFSAPDYIHKLTSMFIIRSVDRSINFLSSYSSRISQYVMHVLAF